MSDIAAGFIVVIGIVEVVPVYDEPPADSVIVKVLETEDSALYKVTLIVAWPDVNEILPE